MVKGNITKVSHGTFKEVAKDSHTSVARNVNTDAAGKINQTAKEGIKYGEPNKRTGSKDEYIDVYIGLFFDGTSNNRINADAKNNNPDAYYEKTDWLSRNDGSNTSYNNDHTNVDKLQEFYPTTANKYFSIYIEGIGTEDLKGDFIAGQTMGWGESGIPAKVKIACQKAASQLKKYTTGSSTKIKKIYIDLVGFSRGATAARHCAYELSKPATNEAIYFSSTGDKQYYISPNDKRPIYLKNPPKTYLNDAKKPPTAKNPAHGFFGQYLEANNVEFFDFEIRYAGLFESVSAYGTDHEDDVDQLHLQSVNAAVHVVHFTAADEHRENFELTPTNKGVQLTFPGVHSDIGGGYLEKDKEEVDLLESLMVDREEIIMKERSRLIEQGWYKSEQLKHNVNYKLTGTRTLSNKYSLVTMTLMKDFLILKCALPKQPKFDKKYEIPSNKNLVDISKAYDRLLDMSEVYDRLNFYSFTNNKIPMKFYTKKEMENFKLLLTKGQVSVDEYNTRAKDHNMLLHLRNRYLHWSANFAGIGMDPKLDSQGNRERVILPLSHTK